jgi:hypothetical protein
MEIFDECGRVKRVYELDDLGRLMVKFAPAKRRNLKGLLGATLSEGQLVASEPGCNLNKTRLSIQEYESASKLTDCSNTTISGQVAGNSCQNWETMDLFPACESAFFDWIPDSLEPLDFDCSWVVEQEEL